MYGYGYGYGDEEDGEHGKGGRICLEAFLLLPQTREASPGVIGRMNGFAERITAP